ncbi:MAG: HupE/UreJ family protein [Alphaproteobacteria bacterium]|nr:HupE/UreJ family protein [Alphaproteobacteria bacterium]
MLRPTTLFVTRLAGLAGAGALALAPAAALAHHPMGGETPATAWHGFLSGLGHPVLGLDHLAFMLGVACLLAVSGAPALRAALFAGASVAGTALVTAVGGVTLAEWGVALSLLAAALLLLRGSAPADTLLSALLVAGGLVHGGALAETVIGAEATPIATYLLGLAAMQALLAVGLTLAAGRLLAARPMLWPMAPRLIGVMLIAVAGLGLAGMVQA